MSANFTIDLSQTCDYPTSIVSLSGGSTSVGRIVDLLGANANTGVWVTATALSGVLPILIQTSDATTSGTFTDPTSGIPTASLPVNVSSGGQFFANSGLWASGNAGPMNPFGSGAPMCSGGIQFASFQRPHRYARLLLTSGTASIANGIVTAGFISQKKITGSGAGQTQSPGSGAISV